MFLLFYNFDKLYNGKSNFIYMFIRKVTFIFILFVAPVFLNAQPSKSLTETQITQYVVDESGTLSDVQQGDLIKKLRDFDKQTSTQIVVYMIRNLDGESLEDASNKIAIKNKIGKKGKDNGVLIFIVKDDKKIRIEVGYGLEGVLTDAISSQIIRNDMAPYFRNNDFYGGINKAIESVMSVSKGEYTVDNKTKKNPGGAPLCLGMPIFVVIVFVFIFFSIFMSIIRRIFGFGFGRGVYSGRSGSGWSNWGGGGFFGGGGSSGGGFGGFSGGGGSFGGGGASGGW
jgi:uncharacterized protein